MTRKVFFSFHYANDAWKVAKIRNIGLTATDFYRDKAEWETIKRQGDTAIKNWIDNQMWGASCVIVLNGLQTKYRRWVQYEIRKADSDRKAMFGIHLNNIKDINGNTHPKGPNPFSDLYNNGNPLYLENRYKLYSPANYQEVYNNISYWIEDAFKKV